MISYTDILTTDLESVRSSILEQDSVRCNLAETRCIAKWNGSVEDMPQDLVDLGCIGRTHAEALAFYGTDSSWVNPYIT